MFTHKRLREFDGADSTQEGNWEYIGPARLINVYLQSASFVGTVVLEGSFDGQTVHTTLDSSLTVDDAAANILTDKGIPYVRVSVTARTGGSVTAVYLVAHE